MKHGKFISMAIAASLAVALPANSALAVEATAKSAVNVRTGPGTSYARIDTLYGGEPVDITECQGNWCFVQHSGPDGWVSGRYLVATGDGSSSSSSSGSSAGNDAAAAAILGVILGGILANRTHSSAPAPSEPELPYGPDTCKTGFVWRDSIPGDHVCVTPASRSAAANENAVAGARVNPTGPYGPNTCIVGYVWREAYSGDKVCVTGARRSQVHQENVNGPSHRVRP